MVVALLDAQQRQANQGSELPPARALVASVKLDAACLHFQTLQEGLVPMPVGVPAAHASNLLALPASHPQAASKEVIAFWFAGSRESGADVQIAASLYDRATQRFDAAFWVANRHDLGAALGVHIRRLGNPVAWADGVGRIHLFVVATGLGGWAASRIVHLRDDGDLKFKPLRVLPLMPLLPSLNTSTLVRAAPLPLADGGAVLPIYFELGWQYGMALRFNAQGEMQSLTRMSARRDVLQPTLVAVTPQHWLAFMRDDSLRERVRMAQTTNGGAAWQDLPDLALSNQDTSLAALHLHTGHWALAHNPAEHGRSVLQLSHSAGNLAAWQTQVLVAGKPLAAPTLQAKDEAMAGENASAVAKPDEFSYPSLIEVPKLQSPKNAPELWLSYTHQRRAIAFKILRPQAATCQKGGAA
jgi:predicted neuraminidase